MSDDEDEWSDNSGDAQAAAAFGSYEVGYKRPPKEHQFKKGQKPQPRKPKAAARRRSPQRLLAQLMAERKRAEIGGKVVWTTTAELVVRTAFKLAAKSPSIQKLLLELRLQAEPSGEPKYITVMDPLDGSPPYVSGGDDYPDLALAYAALAERQCDGTTPNFYQTAVNRDGEFEGAPRKRQSRKPIRTEED